MNDVHYSKLNRENSDQIPVLIVGGGPVGLSASLLLSYHGIRSLLIEQHSGTSVYPKARFINARSMEIFRQVGTEQAIRNVEIPKAYNFILADSLAGKELMRRPIKAAIPESVQQWSPTWASTSSQELIEAALLAQARLHSPAQFRFSMQLVRIEQDEDGILATLVHRPSGRVQHVSARYLIAADGAHSTVRELLGIAMLGKPVLANLINVQFTSDLSQWVGDREISICYLKNSEVTGNLYFYGGKRWKFQTFYYPDQGQRPEDFTPEHCIQLIRAAVGVPDLEVELGEIMPWTPAEQVAEHMHDHYIFLAGDAAHLMSPTGGFGMNSGIQDVHNLAWKLAAAMNGWGAPSLLDSYETERLPVARVLVNQMAHNLSSVPGAPSPMGTDHAANPPQPLKLDNMFSEHNLVFGMTYDSPVIVPDGTQPISVGNPVTDYVPSARPGSRAPHFWLERAGRRISTLDLFGREFVLLAGSRGSAWFEAATSVISTLNVPLQTVNISLEGDVYDPGHDWAMTYGIKEDGAVLVRPDGYVAWRSAALSAEPAMEIEIAIQTALAIKPVHQNQAV